MKFFAYDRVKERVIINDEAILLIREFAALFDEERNKCKADKTGNKKLKAFREAKFIYLFFDWESPYFQFSEQDKYNESVLDAKLTDSEMEDDLFRAACKKYEQIQNASRIGKLLRASYDTVDKITHYLETIDLTERDPVTGKPIFKTKDLIAEIASAGKLIEGIKSLEIQFKKEAETDTSLRGDKQPGMFDRY